MARVELAQGLDSLLLAPSGRRISLGVRQSISANLLEGFNYATALVYQEQLEEAYKALAERISEDYKGKKVNFVVFAEGANAVFRVLQRHLDPDLDYVQFTYKRATYHGTEAGTSLKTPSDFDGANIAGEPLIIIEDIIDRGVVLVESFHTDMLRKNPSELKVLSALVKPRGFFRGGKDLETSAQRLGEYLSGCGEGDYVPDLTRFANGNVIELPTEIVYPTYAGIVIPDLFVIGGGLDLMNGSLRHLDDIYIIAPNEAAYRGVLADNQDVTQIHVHSKSEEEVRQVIDRFRYLAA